MGLLAYTFGGEMVFEVAKARGREMPHLLSLTLEFHYSAHHVLSALIPAKLQKKEVPGISLFVADSASTVNASGNCDGNLRRMRLLSSLEMGARYRWNTTVT